MEESREKNTVTHSRICTEPEIKCKMFVQSDTFTENTIDLLMFCFFCWPLIKYSSVDINKQLPHGAASGSLLDSTAAAEQTRSLQYTFLPAGATKSFTLRLQYLERKYWYSILISPSYSSQIC